MPRITEATVAAHRVAQLTRLMDAAHEIAEEGGAEAVTLASVAQRAGLARSSMYGYFASRDDLIVAVCEDAVVTWCDTIVRSMTAEADPERQLRSYVEAQLAAAADTRHESAMLLLRSGVSAEGLERIKAAHAPLRAALLDTLVRMRLAEPQRAAAFVQAAVTAAYEQIRSGSTPTAVIHDTFRFVAAGLRDLDRAS
ncbi:MAG: TetR/AcrR family transcriptional regulator [Ilumatobacteraceae bacterium]|jgi:AcrR family transcriptional regulator|nr:TetR/AcrR family transcriptional regulator [Acidimicrobiaceae bacterium]MBP6488610.1 TetR/AcrR family transcriptional regulator [Ilumatobacteraceae bacterium]MBK9970023.1 TetR/AcrR family transcriptional regulator [Acidimicrobiaceae bacterium]MBP7890069.1 TetR/AcrR family transcriptional regulator [Ilumatobacteraceae bacterium]MBP8210191.1 TetR/AcrR family transcriptional regulator [Ilumatobacteraceae bacterium]